MPTILRTGAALALACWAARIPRVGAAEPGASDELVLAAKRPSAQLLGLDAHYLYWVEATGREGAEASETLRRVSRQGGASEALAEFPGGVIWPVGFGVTDHAIYVAIDDGADSAGARIVAVGKAAPHRVTTVVGEARALDAFVVAGDRLFWVQSYEVTGLWATRLDGTGRKMIWTVPDHEHVMALTPRGQSILVSLLILRPPPDRGGLGSFGDGRREYGSRLVLVPTNAGTAKDLWSARGELKDAAMTGDDVLVCSEDGLLRVHGAQAIRLFASCTGALRVWHGWRLEFVDVDDQPEDSLLYATKIGAPSGKRTLVSGCASGYSVHTVLPADDGIYFCRRAGAHHCSIVHVPGPPATDRRCGEASAH